MWEAEYIFSFNNISVHIMIYTNKQKLQLQNLFIFLTYLFIMISSSYK